MIASVRAAGQTGSMAVLPWMLFQAVLTGYFLYRETLNAQGLGRAPEPLPVFILSTLGALLIAALVNGLADYLRARRPQAPSGSAPAQRRKARSAGD